MTNKVDLTSVEMRVAAETETPDGGMDMYAETASEIFGIPVDQIKPYQRRAAKTIAFGKLYGIQHEKGLGKCQTPSQDR